MALISREEENALFEKLKAYYEKLYGIPFRKEEATLTPEQIGELYYTYPGEEEEATFEEKVADIAAAVKKGYDAPVIVLKKEKEKKSLVIDGHRRLRVAWAKRLAWPALVLVPVKEIRLGIEKAAVGQIKKLWKV